MKNLVKCIIKNLVDKPDEVQIHELVGSSTLMLEISVAKSDIGKIIGRGGKTIKAIRVLLTSIASRNKIHVGIEILEHPMSYDSALKSIPSDVAIPKEVCDIAIPAE